MNTITITIITIIMLLGSAALLAFSVISLTRIYKSRIDLVAEIEYLINELFNVRIELADLKAKAQAPKAATIPDKVRVSNVIQSVTRYTGRSYAEVAAELRQYPSEKIGRHWYYDRTQAEAIREIYKPKKSNK